MKKRTKTTLLVVALSTIISGCQKEETICFSQNEQIAYIYSHNTIWYSIDGEMYEAKIKDSSDLSALIETLIQLVHEGKTIVMYDTDNENQIAHSKEIYTYTSKDKDDAVNWISKMKDSGYNVSFTYNKETDTYVCTAWK